MFFMNYFSSNVVFNNLIVFIIFYINCHIYIYSFWKFRISTWFVTRKFFNQKTFKSKTFLFYHYCFSRLECFSNRNLEKVRGFLLTFIAKF